MPVTGSRATGHHRLVRLLRVVRGSMRFVIDVKPRFDYGRQEHHLEITDEGAIFHTEQLELTLHLEGGPAALRPNSAPKPNGSAMTCGSTAP